MASGDVARVRMGVGDLGPVMASLQQPSQQQQRQCTDVANSSNIPSRGVSYGKMESAADEFPAGMRVLVVDDDPMCLVILERMLRQCAYQVTTCGKATKALELLREDKDRFDLVISDVYMPDMDGFKLLELVGLEMDLPVIMMSANGETSAVMKGITHGACDYLLKPVRLEELRNIWQHVVRKKRNESKDADYSNSIDENERHRRGGGEDTDYMSSANDTTDGNWKLSKKRKEAKDDEEDNEQDNDDPSTLKKPRVVWSVELHQQFVGAVNQLGIDKAVPKRILEIMNRQGLTRENVASHLQKYRLYLRRLSGVASQQNNMNGSFAGPDTSFGSLAALDSMSDFRTLAASGQLSSQTLAALQAGALGRIGTSNGLGSSGSLDPSMLLQLAALQGGSVGPLPRPRMNPPLLNNQLHAMSGGIDVDHLAQSHHLSAIGQLCTPMDDVTGLSTIQHQLAANGGLGGMGALSGLNGDLVENSSNNALMMQLLQQQQQGGGPGVNLPQAAGLLGSSQINSNDINLGQAGHIGVVNMGNAVGLSGMGPGGRGLAPPLGGTGASLSHSLGGLVRAQSVDVKNLNVTGTSGGSFPAANSVVVTVPSPMGGGAVSPPVLNEGLTQHTMRSNFSVLGNLSHGLGQSLSQKGRPGWPSGEMGPGDFGQKTTLGLSSRYQVTAPSQTHHGRFAPGLQGLQCQPAFMGQGMSFPARLASDGGAVKPSSNGGQCHGEPPTADGVRKVVKDERNLDHLLCAKLEGGLMSQDSSTEDLFNFLLKQQQEGISFTESDLTADGYPLDNLYVK